MPILDEDLADSGAVDPALRCPICMLVYDDAVSAMGLPCQHIFCKSCISQALNVRELCPLDRKPLKARQLRSVQLVNDMVNRIPVKCSNSQRGCTWTGPVDARDAHVARRECQIDCPHKCGERVQISELKMHETSSCKEFAVSCPFARYGCVAPLPRGQVIQHVADNVAEHDAMVRSWEENLKYCAHTRGSCTREPQREISPEQGKGVAWVVSTMIQKSGRQRGFKLVAALYNKDLVLARAILALPNTSTSVPGPHGWRALQLAAKFGWPDIVQRLIGCRADVNSCGSQALTPLDLALTFHHAEAAFQLMSAGGWHSLRYAIEHCDRALVKELLTEKTQNERISLLFTPWLSARSPMALAQHASTRSRRAMRMVQFLQTFLHTQDRGTMTANFADSWCWDNGQWQLHAAMLPRVNFDFDDITYHLGQPSDEGHLPWLSEALQDRCHGRMERLNVLRCFRTPWWETMPLPPLRELAEQCPEIVGRDLLQVALLLSSPAFSYRPSRDAQLPNCRPRGRRLRQRSLMKAEQLLAHILRRGLPWFPKGACTLLPHQGSVIVVPFGLIISSKTCLRKRTRRRLLGWASLRAQPGRITVDQRLLLGDSFQAARRNHCPVSHAVLCSTLRFLSILEYSPEGHIVYEKDFFS